MNDFFVYTEIVRCGEIGVIALRSFYAYHPDVVVHVYGLESDRWAVKEFKKVVYHSLDKPDPKIEPWGDKGIIEKFKMRKRSKTIAANFDHGHLGTASLWANIIQTRPERYLIHFDSDVVFRAPALDDIVSRLKNGYDLVGTMRNYKNNPHKVAGIRGYKDLTQTCFFGFDKTKISPQPYDILTKMCQGTYNPKGFQVLDFFDPVSFDMLDNGAKIYHLSVDDYGGWTEAGDRKNKYNEVNAIVDFGKKFSHFSAVGSGLNFYKNRGKITDVPGIYIQYSLEKYAIYAKLFYDKDIGEPYDENKYKPLFKVKKWY